MHERASEHAGPILSKFERDDAAGVYRVSKVATQQVVTPGDLSLKRSEAGKRGAAKRWQTAIPPDSNLPSEAMANTKQKIADSDSDSDSEGKVPSSERQPRSDEMMERHDSDTTKIKTLSSNPDDFDRAVREIWGYYIASLSRSTHTTLTETRKRMARARLKECFASAREPQLENATNIMKLCIDRLKDSKWHNGNNPGGKKYLTWEILFRSREQFEKWTNDENFCEGAA